MEVHGIVIDGDQDLLDPEDGYPFIEWVDIDSDTQRKILKACIPADTNAAAWRLDDPVRSIPRLLDAALDTDAPTLFAAIQCVVESTMALVMLEEKKQEEARAKALDSPPVPAHPLDLMAMPNEVTKVLRIINAGDKERFSRTTFSRMVNAFTLLRPDKTPARAGDMLGYITTEDTVKREAKLSREVAYEARVMAL